MSHRIGAAGGIQLVEQRADMEFHRVDGNAELTRDHLVGATLRHQRQHVELTLRQRNVLRHDARIASDNRRGGFLAGFGEAKPGDIAEQSSQAIGEGGIVDLQSQHDLGRDVLAHAAGLSPIVTLKLTGSPPRRAAISTTAPTLAGPSVRDSARTPDSFWSLTATMTSPWRMPAAAEGPALSTFITIAPTPSSSRTGCSPRPRYPRAMRPRASNWAAMRSIVAVGITSTRRGPSTAMPKASPEASSARPPSWLGRRRMSSSIRASMSPPRRERQLLPDSDTMPSAALGASRLVAITTDNVPSDGTVAASLTGATAASVRSSATSVVWSRPTIAAATRLPSGRPTSTSPSSASASSAVTIRPGFQTKPVERERCECTVTMDGAVRDTTSASADDSEVRGVESVMAGSCKLSSIWDVAGDRVTGRMARK